MRKYTTEEERKEARREVLRRYTLKHKEDIKRYHLEHKEEIAAYQKQYRKDNKDKLVAQKKEYQKTNAKKIAERKKKYQQEHKEHISSYQKEYSKTEMGRALRLIWKYQQNDKKYDRGECTINAKWIVDNIFSKPCHYCGKEGWKIIGCDRKDSSLPHTPDNCVPCCRECNRKKGTMPYDEYIKKLGDSPNP